MERACFLPGGVSAREREQSFGRATLRIADLSAEEIHGVLQCLRAGAGTLAGIDPSRRRRAIAEAARRFLDSSDSLCLRAQSLLPAVTGFSSEMIRETLPRIFEPIHEAALADLVPPGLRAHPLVAIIAAGNVPGVAIGKMALALACGAACFVKSASGEPVLAALFAEALAAASPELGAATAVTWWAGGDRPREEAVAHGVDSVIAYGSDAAVEAWGSLAPASFVARGHRLSVSVVCLDDASRIGDLAVAAAIDVALYDQLGCLSPQTIYALCGASSEFQAFAEALAAELEALGRRLPRGIVSEGAALAIRRLRDEYEWREIRGEPVRLRASREGILWTILEDPQPRFRPSPLHRTVFLRRLGRAEDLGAVLGEFVSRVECVGIGPWPDEEIVAAVAACGIPYRAPLGRMQSPPLAWPQGGASPLAGVAV